MSKIKKTNVKVSVDKNEKTYIDKAVKILDRRINFLIGGAMGQSTIVIAIIGLILNIKDNDITFFKVIKNQYILGVFVGLELWILAFVAFKTLKYLKTIEKLEGIKGNEDFLK